MDTGLSILFIADLATNPNNAQGRTIFASASSGVFNSEYGEAWIHNEVHPTALWHIRSLGISSNYTNDETIFAGNGVSQIGSSNIFKTEDGGSTWEKVLKIHRHDERGGIIIHQGTWITKSSELTSGMGLALSDETQASAEMMFFGDSIKWIGTRTDYRGAEVYVDDVSHGSVDSYSSQPQWQVVLFSKSGLGPGLHSITIVVTGLNNPASSGTTVAVDAFEVGD
ncbi:MAG TPA: hypothetical protein VMX75_13945 [Spirochaetia bacterium]|nr:hypothetical protein [Spirochaetia bacterium]